MYHLYQSECRWGCSCNSRKESAEGPPAEGPPIGSPPGSPAYFDRLRYLGSKDLITWPYSCTQGWVHYKIMLELCYKGKGEGAYWVDNKQFCPSCQDVLRPSKGPTPLQSVPAGPETPQLSNLGIWHHTPRARYLSACADRQNLSA